MLIKITERERHHMSAILVPDNVSNAFIHEFNKIHLYAIYGSFILAPYMVERRVQFRMCILSREIFQYLT